MALTKQDVIEAGLVFPCVYQDASGSKFLGIPVSQVSQALRDNRWKNVSRLDSYDLKQLGCAILRARYCSGGGRLKKECDVVFLKEYVQS